ncbi:hypothetical protein HOLleu_01502 [Holothuria leucospilota]|uniref:Tc1-like transposase DDE domain-containing protein n=1 Tax=Holothuria leucospilota TaxID=206669 RepID=A0A9Q1HJ98_HOLLE|nr:hypothetical protein HOLleu_01502 [Holothuria leucospilota]
MQDNDPKHTSKPTKEFVWKNNTYWWPTPSESPGSNPIEMVWHELKHFLRIEHKPHVLEELKDGITTFWRTRMTPKEYQRYVTHIQKVLPKVVQFDGKLPDFDRCMSVHQNLSFDGKGKTMTMLDNLIFCCIVVIMYELSSMFHILFRLNT